MKFLLISYFSDRKQSQFSDFTNEFSNYFKNVYKMQDFKFTINEIKNLQFLNDHFSELQNKSLLAKQKKYDKYIRKFDLVIIGK